MARPTFAKDDSARATLLVLVIGGAVVLGLAGFGLMVWLRQPEPNSLRPAVASTLATTAPSAAPRRLEPSSLLADARRQASAWQHDAVLVSLSASPLDARGVAEDGKVTIMYAKPSGQRISGGAETGGERLVLTTGGGALVKSEEHAAKSRVAPEPNCLFEDAWRAAQRAGDDPSAGLGMRYVWSEKHARTVWEVLSRDGNVLRRLDGVSCSILTR